MASHMQKIEAASGFKLPASACTYRAWRANDVTHSQASAWLKAGWSTRLEHVS